jgi:glycerol kinase
LTTAHRKCLLALDQGTSSSRSIVFDAHGRILAMAQREFRQIYPRPGWVEHDPKEILESQLATAREALAKAASTATDIAAIGITNQRETTLVWNRATGEPVCNAIVWQDRRAEPTCADAARTRPGADVPREDRPDPRRLFLRHQAQVDPRQRGRRARRADRGELAFGTVDTWLMWHLTGGKVHATDVTNASRTLMLDVHTNDDGSDELLAILDVPARHAARRASVQPRVRRHAGPSCSARHPHRRRGRRPAGALFGQACFRPGLAKNTYGTGCFMLMNTGATFQTAPPTA